MLFQEDKMHHLRRVFVVLLVWTATISAQSPAPKPDNVAKAQEDIARIVGYSMTRGGASEFLETLTDTIGGRITGSSESKAAAELILNALKEGGLENPHFEEYELGSVWRPGQAVGEVISPVHRALYLGSYGWAPGTPGPIEVPVVDFGTPGEGRIPTPEQVRGAVTIVDQQSSGV